MMPPPPPADMRVAPQHVTNGVPAPGWNDPPSIPKSGVAGVPPPAAFVPAYSECECVVGVLVR